MCVRVCVYVHSVQSRQSCPPPEQCNGCFVPQVVMTLTWNKQDSLFFVPVWIIILAVLAGLLLLALLIYFLYKVTNYATDSARPQCNSV